ncbi:hypothetical protein [Abyssalbus ytuae]|uniref:Uncharacterized protein n=1 Tax=Abyssalbus ytuae TaxID=2926907 RepID=A0A9E6ZKX0_9FLAO|nr:hypothetical protein [Abyssalbus ytuae]UOB15975.1 hypothetical protein MQE35_09505 [Abyssalbus ytuae]
MKPLFLISLLFSVFAFSQNINETGKLRANETKEYHLAANQGDDIDITLDKIEGGKLNISLHHYEGERIFIDKKIKNFWTKIIAGPKGVYVIKVENPNKKEAEFTLKVKTDSHGGSSAKLVYKTFSDTTYKEPVKRKNKIEVLETKTLQNEKFYLNSRSNAYVKGGKNRVFFPIYLPENTVEWYYVFSASRNEDDIKNTITSFSLASELTGIINNKQSLAGSVSNLSTPPGADICDIYVLDEANLKLFSEKEDFDYKIDASRQNYKSGLIQVKEDYGSKVYLGINNPDNLYGIHVGIEVVAIVKTKKEIEEDYREPVVTTRRIPVAE